MTINIKPTSPSAMPAAFTAFTLRLPLGKIALNTIALKLESIHHDLEANRHIAENAVYLEGD
jgi:hypothetical protein